MANQEGVTDRWFVRFTRFGTVHLVRSQSAGCSCGIASSMMACCRANKLTTIEQGMYIEKDVYKKYDPSGSYDGTSYTFGDKLVALLDGLGIGKWKCTNYGETGIGAAIVAAGNVYDISSMPVIAHIVWDGGGAHFVLIDDVIDFFGDLYACVNDPWDGDVHVTKFTTGATIPYKAESPTFSVDFWGSRNKYGGGGKGKFSGWLIQCAGLPVTNRPGNVMLSGKTP